MMTRCCVATTSVVALILLSACVAPPPEAPKPPPLPGKEVHYTCTGSTHLTVVYGDGKVTLPGPETLLADDGTNQRYSWPADGKHHVWSLSGEIGTLSLHDSAKGTETVEKSGCKPDGVAR